MAMLSRMPDPLILKPFAGVEETAAFRPIGILAPWQAPGGGGYGIRVNPPLNQTPAYWSGLQLKNGISGLRSGWFFPSPSQQVTPQIRATQQWGGYPGAQRSGSVYGGALGLIDNLQMREAVVANQIRQSGLAATKAGAALFASGNA
jgi:hypothetical protein